MSGEELAAPVGPSAEVVRVARLTDVAVEAVIWRDPVKLEHALMRLIKVSFSEEVAFQTGIARLAADKSLWRRLSPEKAAIAATLEEKWRRGIRQHVGARPPRSVLGGMPFAGQAAGDFSQDVEALFEWLLLVDPVKPPVQAARRLAGTLVLLGFRRWQLLDGAEMSDVLPMLPAAADRALCSRALVAATIAGATRKKVVLADAASANVAQTVTAAGRLAERLTEEKMQSAEQYVEEQAKTLGVASFTEAKPMQVIKSLGVAAAAGRDVDGLLQTRVEVLKTETARRSLPSVASGLRAWHEFAVVVLGYPEDSTLPPRKAEDVEKFVGIFANGRSAANYVGYVKMGVCALGDRGKLVDARLGPDAERR